MEDLVALLYPLMFLALACSIIGTIWLLYSIFVDQRFDSGVEFRVVLLMVVGGIGFIVTAIAISTIEK
ncbi:hypothetical protein ACIBG8_14570 [Nonomuraea sp. NPDC050556]|uniref:hypothetical protein n=1 Tax=Nonomuraea sp. NPDC050556 TaxID=3364369 RepID=UPI00378ABC85